MDRHLHRPRAFTLVELLVVIGIIGALIAILLPVLSGVQARGRDIKCQSNIRQILQAIHGYVTENKGSMPYGFYWNRSRNNLHPDPFNPANDWGEAGDNAGSSGDPDNDHPFISWASLVGKYMAGKGASGDNDDFNFPPVLRCPEAEQQHDHVLSYVINIIVGISPFNELRVGPAPRAQLKPPHVGLMLKETALVWDTPIRPNWQNNVGYLMSADIDGQRMWEGALYPQQRYYSIRDPFERLGTGVLGNNRPVGLNVGANVFRNIDPPATPPNGNGPTFPYQGNLRFRHGKNTICNVGFADGSVRQFTAKLNSDKSVAKHDAIRRYFMIKWPAGASPNPSRPF